MAIDTTRQPVVALRPSWRVLGHPKATDKMVVQPIVEALAPCAEGVALADEVLAHVNELLLAAAAGSRQRVVNEAGRLGYRASQYRETFREMAAAIESPEPERAA